MDSFTLLCVGVLTNALVHIFFRRAPVSLAERRDDDDDKKRIADVEPDSEKKDPRIFLPRLLVGWPWPRQNNPHYDVVLEEFNAWAKSLPVFSSKVEDAYYRSNFALLSCLFYPTLNKDHVRAGCDLMQVFIVVDEYTDRSTPAEVRNQKAIVLDALRNPHVPRPKDEWIGGEVTRQFWEFAIRDATELMQKRFIKTMDEYLEGVVQESVNKEDRRILDVKTHIELRRWTSGAEPVLMMIELEIDLPDEAVEHPAIRELVHIADDLISLCNDVVSFNREQMRGDDQLHNIITCVMNEYNTDVNGAMLWAQDYISQLCERYLAGMASLPQWEEPLNSRVKDYCNRVAHVVRGNYEWSFESERYLGNKNSEIQENRWMSLFPKKSETEIGTIATY